MLKKIIITPIVVLFLINPLLSQNQSNTYSADTTHINELIIKTKQILFIHPDSANMYLDTIGEMSGDINYDFGLYNYYNLKGIVFGMYGNQEAAIDSYKQGFGTIVSNDFPRRKAILLLNIGLEYWRMYLPDSATFYYDSTLRYCLNHNVKDLIPKCLFDLGNIYLEENNYIEAAGNFIKAREGLIKNNDSVLLVYLHGAFGVLYTRTGDFDLALENYQKSIEYDQKLPQVNNMANSYNNIGQLYFENKQEYDSALVFYRRSLSAALPHQKADFHMATNINTGNVYLETGNLDSAFFYYSNVLNDPLLEYYPDRKAALLVNLGSYYYYSRQYHKARTYLNKGVNMCDTLNLAMFQATGVMKLYKIDSIENKLNSALKRFNEYHRIADTLQAQSDLQEIAALEFDNYITKQKYNNELLIRENEMNEELIANQQRLLIVITIALISIIVASILLLFARRKRNILLLQVSEQNEELQNTNEELKSINEVLHNQREELNHLNQTKDKFFSIIGHDLKSPFNYILGILEILDDSWDSFTEDKRKEYVNGLHTSSKNTYRLLENLLSWGRAQQGLLDFEKSLFSVYPEVVSLVDLVKPELQNKNISIKINIPTDAELNTDPRYFNQIIQNLLINAIKFTHSGGEISIIMDQNKERSSICVVDNGIGIPKDKLPTIFNIESDFGRPGTANEKSTGMGLILCKEYADLIGAYYDVTSTVEEPDRNKRGSSSFCLVFDN